MSGFKKTTVLGDSGYIKKRKGGGRYHKLTRSGPVHIDKHDPARSLSKAIKHVQYDFFGAYADPKRRKRHRLKY